MQCESFIIKSANFIKIVQSNVLYKRDKYDIYSFGETNKAKSKHFPYKKTNQASSIHQRDLFIASHLTLNWNASYVHKYRLEIT